MNGNFQNNYRGGWNHIPFIGFSPGPFNYNYQIPLYWPPYNYNYQIPPQNPANYTDNRPLLHQMQPHYVDNRHLRHQRPTYYYDSRHLTPQMPPHYFGPRPLPRHTSEHHADKRNLPQQTAEHCNDKRCLPHQKAEDDADNKCLPHQTSEECYADKMNLPQQSPDLPQQTPEDYVDKKCSPHQMLEPTIPAVATLQRERCEICGVVFPLKNLGEHNNGKKHRRMLIELREKSTKRETSNEEERIHIQNSQKNPVVQHKKVRCLVKNTSHDAPRFEYKDVPAEGSKRKLRDHTGAKDHDFNVENVKHGAPSFQKKKVPAVKSKRKVRDNTDAKGHGSKRETGEAPGGKYMKMSNEIRSVKNDQPQSTLVELKASAGSNISAETAIVTPEVHVASQEFTPSPAVESSFEPSGQINSETEVEEGKEHLDVQNCSKESNDQPHSISMEFHGPAGSDINTLIGDTCSDSGAIVLAVPQSPIVVQVSTPVAIIPTEMSESKVQNDIVDSNDQQRSISTELHDPAGSMTNNQTEIVNFDSAAIEIVIEPLASAPPHTETEPQVSEAVAYIENQHHTEEIDIEPLPSVLLEIDETENGSSIAVVEMDDLADDPAGSDINTMIEDTGSDFGAIVIASQHSPIASQAFTPVAVIQTEMSESKVHNEVQRDIVDSNDQQRSISMELHDPTGSMTNNQTEIVNFDSAAIEIFIEPLASAWPDAAGSSFELMTECGLHTETEPQVLEAVAYIESQHPIEETDIEIGAASEVSVETETEDGGSQVEVEINETKDGGSQVEVEMDILAGELEKIHLPQVSVCLTCGNEGFKEAIVYCSKCGDYAMHRYCLKGPVVFTDDIIWFCEDCEEEILDADYPDSRAADSEKCEVDSSKKCATFVDPQPIVDPIWRGSLQVFNKSFDKMTRLKGHLSTLACPKVFEETRRLPNVLYGDLVQRSAVWPESFKKFGTNNLSIGLYFFPQNESCDIVSPHGIKFSVAYLAAANFAAKVVRYYDQLVDEMISNDLAIRVWVEKAELLIFSSTMLPSQYKRFQSKYYLWGIFKRKQEPFKINDIALGNDMLVTKLCNSLLNT